MSLLAYFDDGECRAWFAAVLAIRAIPNPPRARHDARRSDAPEQREHGPAHTNGAVSRLHPQRT
jgi:hypothetical protein